MAWDVRLTLDILDDLVSCSRPPARPTVPASNRKTEYTFVPMAGSAHAAVRNTLELSRPLRWHRPV